MLKTPALQKIKKYNTNKIEMEMAGYCRDIMERLGQDRILCCPKDFIDELRDCGLRADVTQVRSILKEVGVFIPGKTANILSTILELKVNFSR
jgi:hypothetical protein